VGRSLDAIWTRHRPELHDRVLLLERAVDALADGTLEEAGRIDAQRTAHKLAGSLGMFGLDAGTDASREVEQILAAPTRRDVGTLLARVSALATLVERGPDTQVLDPALLIVSGDPGFSRRVVSQATDRGLRTVVSAGPAEGREWLLEATPCAVLVDLEGLGEDGLRLIGSIDGRAGAPPVLVVGAAADVLDRVQVAGLGARGFFPPGTDTARLIEAVIREVEGEPVPKGASVLAVDDDPVVLAVLERLLEPMGIELTSTSDPMRFWDLLDQGMPDLVIFDVDMPGVDGIELCRALRNDPQSGAVPVMFLSARTDAETVQRMFATGADDYVPKPIVPLELTTRIGNRLERASLARRLADTDGLTGLATRRKAEDVLARLLRLAVRHEDPLSLAIIDIDHFKSVNDDRGHPAGDEVLRRLAQLLRTAFRGEDVVARWGGEEFLVGMYGIDSAGAVRRIRELLADFRGDGITFSAGVATYPHHGHAVDSLYRAADTALYVAKSQGRDRVLAAG
jgi:diguanylate cyclase (GGDEF)-like protein